MVHALKEAQRLLKSDVRLMDIQPLIEAPVLKVYQGNRIIFAEPDPGYDYEEDLRQADTALIQAIRRGLFVIEERADFDFLTHASSAQELRAFWGTSDTDE